MYYAMRASTPSLHRESTDSLIHTHCFLTCVYNIIYEIYSIQSRVNMLKNFQFTLRRFHYGACTHYIPFLLLIDICERRQSMFMLLWSIHTHNIIHTLSNFIF